MADAGGGEGGGVVLGLVEADDVGDAQVAEERDVVLRAESAAALLLISVGLALEILWASEGDELVGDDLVEVGVERAVQLSVLVDVDLAPLTAY